MANFELALLSFGKLIGLMDGSGLVQWFWFADPLTETLKGIPANRERFGELLNALLEPPAGKDPYFDDADPNDKLLWESLGPAEAQFGLVWNESTAAPFRLGLGARGTIPISSKQLTLTALGRVIKITADGDVSSELGGVRFGAGFPVPEFLQSAQLTGVYEQDNGGLAFDLTVSHESGSRTLTFPTSQLPWDFARLALLVLQAWIHKQGQDQSPAPPPKGLFRRLDEHLYPMLGVPSNPIQAFPLIGDEMGQPPVFDGWKDSILTTDENGAGALTFLWHLRALVTGNEDPNVFSGSTWFPLVAGQQSTASPVPVPQVFPGNVGDTYPPNPDVPGVWLGVRAVPDTVPAEYELVLAFRNGQPEPQGARYVSLLKVGADGVRVLPTVPNGTVADLAAFLAGMSALSNVQPQQAMKSGGSAGMLATATGTQSVIAAGAGNIEFDAATGRLTLVSEELEVPPELSLLGGTYSLQLVLREGQPIAFRFGAPLLGMELPPNVSEDDIPAMVAGLLQWVATAVLGQNGGKWGELTTGVIDAVAATIQGGSPDWTVLFGTVVDLIAEITGVSGVIDLDPISIGVSGTTFTPSLEIGPIQPEKLESEQGVSYYIGKIKLSGTVDLAQMDSPLQALGVSIYDIRLGTGDGTAGSGLVASLIPDLRETKGFFISLSWSPGEAPAIEGGGKIPIQKTIGPLDIVALLVDLRKNSLSVGIDLAFQLAMIRVAVYELGIKFNFDGSDPEPFLHGLALGFDGGGIKLSGMFAEVKQQDGSSDYVGGAVVSIVNMFELSAIGAYTEHEGEASLFIFASLVAPLGGPPYFFVTGIAGGFGYNRALPPPGLLTEHPFMKVMRGEVPMGGGADAVGAISALFVAQKGSYWIAAGIQFTSFGFITGKVVVAVAFGNKFSFTILGLASFGIKPLAYFELGLEVTADEEHFLLKAGLSSNSYIIHPDIFSLRGDFGLGVWYASPHAGDFILSVGGYHPYFEPPSHYPELSRVGVKCVVYGFIRLSVECFFACTPQALMAGASLSLSAEFEGIGAGLDVYVDVFIRWDPFFLQAGMGVALWFEFMGRHEISVDLRIHTPPLGGTATIDLALISFDVDFGSSLSKPPAPRLHQFMTKQLGAPAEADGAQGARVGAFNSDDAAGLFRIDLLHGRTTKQQSASAKQEGIGTPLAVAAEFAFTVKTKIPVNEDSPNSSVGASLTGEVDLGLCERKNLDTVLQVAAANILSSRRTRLANYFPIANFGEPLSAAQADDVGARQAVATTASGDPAIALTEGIAFEYQALLSPFPATPLVGLAEEDSQAAEEFPLPLGWPYQGQQTWRIPRSATAFKNVPLVAHIAPRVPKKSMQEAALEDMQSRAVPPLVVWLYEGSLQRYRVGAQFKGLNVSMVAPVMKRTQRTTAATAPRAEYPIIALPSSPLRRAELFGVNLRVVPPRSSIVLQKGRLETLTRAPNFSRQRLVDEVRGTYAASGSVATGKALTLELRGGRRPKQTLTLTGKQTVRAIFQGGAHDVIADHYITGSLTLAVPVRARRVTLIGEGLYPPLRTRDVVMSSTQVSETLGIEHDSTLLALGRTTFAAHGCVLVANTALPFSARVLDSVPGFEVLRGASNFTILWPALASGSLLLTVEPIGAGAGLAVQQVRWAAVGADLRGLSTVVGSAATALVMDLTAPKPWRLEIDLGKKWRLTGAAILGKSARSMTDWLKVRQVWDVVDDRLQAGSEDQATKAVLEVSQ